MKNLIYAVEDDANIRELVKYTLESGGFDVKVFASGEDFFSALKNEKPALVILDVMLSTEISGFDILKTIKTKYISYSIKVIMLSAKNSEMNIVSGLNLGADDYITKPFSVLELVARVKANLRKLENSNIKKEGNEIVFGKIKLMLNKNIVYENDKEIYLTQKEFDILKLLIENAGRVVDRENMFERIWGAELVESRTIDMHIKTLREKIEFCSRYIITVRSIGYKIVED